MKLDLTTIIHTLDGRSYTMPDSPQPMTLGRLIVRSLLASGDPADTQTKARRFEMALDLHGKEEANLPADGIAVLRQVIGMAWITEVVGQADRLLSGKEQLTWPVVNNGRPPQEQVELEPEPADVEI